MNETQGLQPVVGRLLPNGLGSHFHQSASKAAPSTLIAGLAVGLLVLLRVDGGLNPAEFFVRDTALKRRRSAGHAHTPVSRKE